MTNRDPIRNRRSALCAAASGLAVCLVAASVALSPALMSGCKKEAPPAPPPPPPVVVNDAPPPPPPVDMKAIRQQVKADKRVQVSDNVSTTKEPLAKAVIQFADALAKGDKAKFGAMLDPASKRILDSLVEDGKWEEETKKIEVVRVVSLRPGGDIGPSATGMNGSKAELREKLKTLLDGFNARPEIREQIKAINGGEDMPTEPDAFVAWMKEKVQQAKDSGQPLPPRLESVQVLLDAWDNAPDAAAPSAPSGEESDVPHSLVIAIQEPGGVAYAGGWVAVPLGGKWVFKASPSPMPGGKSRALDFDNADEAPPPPPETPEKTDDKPAESEGGGGGGDGGKGGTPTGG